MLPSRVFLVAWLLVVGACPADGAAPFTPGDADALPEHALARLGTVRLRHVFRDDAACSRLQFSSDGRWLLCQSFETLSVFDAGTGKLAPWLPEITHLLFARFRSDGKALVTWERRPAPKG